MKHNHALHITTKILLIIGGLNLGIMGLLDTDTILHIFGDSLSRIIFVLIGLSAVYRLGIWASDRAK
jgi:uncharacterized membrane protein YuzA (DUF378 family)